MDYLNLIYGDISTDEMESRLVAMNIIESKAKGITVANIKPGTNTIIEIINQFPGIKSMCILRYISPEILGPIFKAKYLEVLHLTQDYVTKPNFKINNTVKEVHLIFTSNLVGEKITKFFTATGCKKIEHVVFGNSEFVMDWKSIQVPTHVKKLSLITPELTGEMNQWFANNGFIMYHRSSVEVLYKRE